MEISGYIRTSSSGIQIKFQSGEDQSELDRDSYLHKIISSLYRLVIAEDKSSDIILGKRYQVNVVPFRNGNCERFVSTVTSLGTIRISKFALKADKTPTQPDHARFSITLPVQTYQEEINREQTEETV